MSSPETLPTPRRRGRPADVDPERVALLALRHFADHGYEATTMDDIAQLAGISRRTLFRYFPSKSDLVWGGIEPVIERLRSVLDSADPAEPTIDVVHRAIVRSLAFPPDRLEATRRRLVLIANDESLIAAGLSRLSVNRDIVSSFVAEREGLGDASLRAQVLADTLSAAMFSALTWWARHSPDDPRDIVASALRDLRDGVTG